MEDGGGRLPAGRRIRATVVAKLIFAAVVFIASGLPASAGWYCRQIGIYTYCTDYSSGKTTICRRLGNTSYCNWSTKRSAFSNPRHATRMVIALQQAKRGLHASYSSDNGGTSLNGRR